MQWSMDTLHYGFQCFLQIQIKTFFTEPEISDLKEESLYITEEKEELPESTCHCQ